MRPSTAKSVHAVERGEEVLDAAAIVFSRKGYEGTSIDDIADELGATKGRVYHYYRSKADLLLGVLRMGAKTLIDVVRPLAEDDSLPPDVRLLNMSRAHATMMMTHHPYQYVSLLSFDQLSFEGQGARQSEWTTIRDLRDEYERLFLSVVEEGCSGGVFRAGDFRVMVRGLLGALNWITVWYRPDAESAARRVSTHEIAETLARFVVAGARDGSSDPQIAGRAGGSAPWK